MSGRLKVRALRVTDCFVVTTYTLILKALFVRFKKVSPNDLHADVLKLRRDCHVYGSLVGGVSRKCENLKPKINLLNNHLTVPDVPHLMF
jgi:hypothetical protein